MKKIDTDRRETLKMLGLGGSAGILGLFGGANQAQAREQQGTPRYAHAMKPIKIRSVKAIATAPQGSNLIVVKVETTEPGLYGLGCATFTQRAATVIVAINTYLNEFCVGKDVDKHRRHVASRLREFILAKWARFKQRFEWLRPSPVGY